MQIDWITVGAQIVNFLVLVWLLHRFLYGPITKAMDRRERRIAERLREAETAREEAAAEAHTYRERQEELAHQKDRLLAEAREAAEQEKRVLERAAREEVETLRRGWLHDVADQQASFLRDVRQRSVEHFFALARKALRDLADEGLEGQIANVFISHLKSLDKETIQRLSKACAAEGNTIAVRSRFELAENERRRMTRAVHELILDGSVVEYEDSDDLSSGIELKAGGQSVAWNLDSYFDDLEKRIAKDLAERGPRGEASAA